MSATSIIHGTGREDLIGTPLSHGVRMPAKSRISCGSSNGQRRHARIHRPAARFYRRTPVPQRPFHRIFGSGMSALAQYLRFPGITVSGSGSFPCKRRILSPSGDRLEERGVPSFIRTVRASAADTDAVCVSTAIEDSNPEHRCRPHRGIPISIAPPA